MLSVRFALAGTPGASDLAGAAAGPASRHPGDRRPASACLSGLSRETQWRTNRTRFSHAPSLAARGGLAASVADIDDAAGSPASKRLKRDGTPYAPQHRTPGVTGEKSTGSLFRCLWSETRTRFGLRVRHPDHSDRAQPEAPREEAATRSKGGTPAVPEESNLDLGVWDAAVCDAAPRDQRAAADVHHDVEAAHSSAALPSPPSESGVRPSRPAFLSPSWASLTRWSATLCGCRRRSAAAATARPRVPTRGGRRDEKPASAAPPFRPRGAFCPPPKACGPASPAAGRRRVEGGFRDSASPRREGRELQLRGLTSDARWMYAVTSVSASRRCPADASADEENHMGAKADNTPAPHVCEEAKEPHPLPSRVIIQLQAFHRGNVADSNPSRIVCDITSSLLAAEGDANGGGLHTRSTEAAAAAGGAVSHSAHARLLVRDAVNVQGALPEYLQLLVLLSTFATADRRAPPQAALHLVQLPACTVLLTFPLPPSAARSRRSAPTCERGGKKSCSRIEAYAQYLAKLDGRDDSASTELAGASAILDTDTHEILLAIATRRSGVFLFSARPASWRASRLAPASFFIQPPAVFSPVLCLLPRPLGCASRGQPSERSERETPLCDAAPAAPAPPYRLLQRNNNGPGAERPPSGRSSSTEPRDGGRERFHWGTADNFCAPSTSSQAEDALWRPVETCALRYLPVPSCCVRVTSVSACSGNAEALRLLSSLEQRLSHPPAATDVQRGGREPKPALGAFFVAVSPAPRTACGCAWSPLVLYIHPRVWRVAASGSSARGPSPPALASATAPGSLCEPEAAAAGRGGEASATASQTIRRRDQDERFVVAPLTMPATRLPPGLLTAQDGLGSLAEPCLAGQFAFGGARAAGDTRLHEALSAFGDAREPSCAVSHILLALPYIPFTSYAPASLPVSLTPPAPPSGSRASRGLAAGASAGDARALAALAERHAAASLSPQRCVEYGLWLVGRCADGGLVVLHALAARRLSAAPPQPHAGMHAAPDRACGFCRRKTLRFGVYVHPELQLASGLGKFSCERCRAEELVYVSGSRPPAWQRVGQPGASLVAAHVCATTHALSLVWLTRPACAEALAALQRKISRDSLAGDRSHPPSRPPIHPARPPPAFRAAVFPVASFYLHRGCQPGASSDSDAQLVPEEERSGATHAQSRARNEGGAWDLVAKTRAEAQPTRGVVDGVDLTELLARRTPVAVRPLQADAAEQSDAEGEEQGGTDGRPDTRDKTRRGGSGSPRETSQETGEEQNELWKRDSACADQTIDELYETETLLWSFLQPLTPGELRMKNRVGSQTLRALAQRAAASSAPASPYTLRGPSSDPRAAAASPAVVRILSCTYTPPQDLAGERAGVEGRRQCRLAALPDRRGSVSDFCFPDFREGEQLLQGETTLDVGALHAQQGPFSRVGPPRDLAIPDDPAWLRCFSFTFALLGVCGNPAQDSLSRASPPSLSPSPSPSSFSSCSVHSSSPASSPTSSARTAESSLQGVSVARTPRSPLDNDHAAEAGSGDSLLPDYHEAAWMLSDVSASQENSISTGLSPSPGSPSVVSVNSALDDEGGATHEAAGEPGAADERNLVAPLSLEVCGGTNGRRRCAVAESEETGDGQQMQRSDAGRSEPDVLVGLVLHIEAGEVAVQRGLQRLALEIFTTPSVYCRPLQCLGLLPVYVHPTHRLLAFDLLATKGAIALSSQRGCPRALDALRVESWPQRWSEERCAGVEPPLSSTFQQAPSWRPVASPSASSDPQDEIQVYIHRSDQMLLQALLHAYLHRGEAAAIQRILLASAAEGKRRPGQTLQSSARSAAASPWAFSDAFVLLVASWAFAELDALLPLRETPHASSSFSPASLSRPSLPLLAGLLEAALRRVDAEDFQTRSDAAAAASHANQDPRQPGDPAGEAVAQLAPQLESIARKAVTLQSPSPRRRGSCGARRLGTDAERRAEDAIVEERRAGRGERSAWAWWRLMQNAKHALLLKGLEGILAACLVRLTAMVPSSYLLLSSTDPCLLAPPTPASGCSVPPSGSASAASSSFATPLASRLTSPSSVSSISSSASANFPPRTGKGLRGEPRDLAAATRGVAPVVSLPCLADFLRRTVSSLSLLRTAFFWRDMSLRCMYTPAKDVRGDPRRLVASFSPLSPRSLFASSCTRAREPKRKRDERETSEEGGKEGKNRQAPSQRTPRSCERNEETGPSKHTSMRRVDEKEKRGADALRQEAAASQRGDESMRPTRKESPIPAAREGEENADDVESNFSASSLSLNRAACLADETRLVALHEALIRAGDGETLSLPAFLRPLQLLACRPRHDGLYRLEGDDATWIGARDNRQEGTMPAEARGGARSVSLVPSLSPVSASCAAAVEHAATELIPSESGGKGRTGRELACACGLCGAAASRFLFSSLALCKAQAIENTPPVSFVDFGHCSAAADDGLNGANPAKRRSLRGTYARASSVAGFPRLSSSFSLLSQDVTHFLRSLSGSLQFADALWCLASAEGAREGDDEGEWKDATHAAREAQRLLLPATLQLIGAIPRGGLFEGARDRDASHDDSEDERAASGLFEILALICNSLVYLQQAIDLYSWMRRAVVSRRAFVSFVLPPSPPSLVPFLLSYLLLLASEASQLLHAVARSPLDSHSCDSTRRASCVSLLAKDEGREAHLFLLSAETGRAGDCVRATSERAVRVLLAESRARRLVRCSVLSDLLAAIPLLLSSPLARPSRAPRRECGLSSSLWRALRQSPLPSSSALCPRVAPPRRRSEGGPGAAERAEVGGSLASRMLTRGDLVAHAHLVSRLKCKVLDAGRCGGSGGDLGIPLGLSVEQSGVQRGIFPNAFSAICQLASLFLSFSQKAEAGASSRSQPPASPRACSLPRDELAWHVQRLVADLRSVLEACLAPTWQEATLRFVSPSGSFLQPYEPAVPAAPVCVPWCFSPAPVRVAPLEMPRGDCLRALNFDRSPFAPPKPLAMPVACALSQKLSSFTASLSLLLSLLLSPSSAPARFASVASAFPLPSSAASLFRSYEQASATRGAEELRASWWRETLRSLLLGCLCTGAFPLLITHLANGRRDALPLALLFAALLDVVERGWMSAQHATKQQRRGDEPHGQLRAPGEPPCASAGGTSSRERTRRAATQPLDSVFSPESLSPSAPSSSSSSISSPVSSSFACSSLERCEETGIFFSAAHALLQLLLRCSEVAERDEARNLRAVCLASPIAALLTGASGLREEVAQGSRNPRPENSFFIDAAASLMHNIRRAKLLRDEESGLTSTTRATPPQAAPHRDAVGAEQGCRLLRTSAACAPPTQQSLQAISLAVPVWHGVAWVPQSCGAKGAHYDVDAD
ncbi:hypothetical protein BESB_050640 [Besnoitia besnoiti]|uniref:Uncharacterized protein n=1 Tax=Besnoitia besnoiti TaxID=94643 RepID=A0A2A9MMS7_BESBE|nr:hypothetical protein BESB_050640 [Besnoitia besnoiti]PFH36872.1 hypothetical protein BESB_050640 [Besnoitia besnoiti]